ncbi:MAG: hypothetical protein WD208_09075 [Dehalococcoidia bacterium]
MLADARVRELRVGSRFCTAFDELRNYLTIQATAGVRITSSERKQIVNRRWSALMAELSV